MDIHFETFIILMPITWNILKNILNLKYIKFGDIPHSIHFHLKMSHAVLNNRSH